MIYMTNNFYKSEIDRELLLNIEIQKQNLKALPDKFKAQKKVVSPVTQQMIDDYKKQFRDLYKRGTGNTSKFFRFLIPDALPTLEKLDDDAINILKANGTLKQEFTVDDIKNKNEKLDELILDYQDQEQGLRDQYRIIEESKNKINKLTAKRSEIIRKYRSIDKSKEFDSNTLENLEDIENKINDNEKRKKISEDEIPKIIKILENITTKINELKKQLEENDENILSNEKYLYTIEQNNRKKLAEYAETLKIMNEGQIDVTRGQDESEDDYLKRLGDVALIEEDLTIVYLFNNNEFKKNLKTIVSSEWKIENISKAFTNDDKFLLNKTIAGFKKYFKDKTGLGNKNLDVDEYIALIRDYMDSEGVQIFKKITDDTDNKGDDKKVFKSASDYPEQEELIQSKEIDTSSQIDFDGLEGDPIPKTFKNIDDLDFELIQQKQQESSYNEQTKFQNTFISSNRKDTIILENRNQYKDDPSTELYIRLSSPKKGKKIKKIEFSYLNDVYEEIPKEETRFRRSIANIFNGESFYLDEDDYEIFMNECKSDSGNITPTEFIDFVEYLIKNPPNTLEQIGSGFRKSKKSKRKKIIVQKGASVKQVDKFVEFGNLILLLRKLYDTNVLSIKDKTGINIPGIPNQKVNDNFVNLILKIVNNEDVNLKEIDDLNQKDSILFTVLMNKAGLKKKYQINNVRTLEALSKRLELLEGEFEAGNDNDIMIKELYEIVFKLAYLGAITLSNAKKHYKQTVKLLKKN